MMQLMLMFLLLVIYQKISDFLISSIGATSKVESLDSNLRRSGRFDKEIMLLIPDEKARLKIFETKTKNLKMRDVEITKLAKSTPGYVGADIEALIKEVFDIDNQ